MSKQDTYGTWLVTTEGDVEGRTIHTLGVFTGYIDEIAFHLANKCYYTLHFKETETKPQYESFGGMVNIRVDSDTKGWRSEDISLDGIRERFSDRAVKITEGNYYRSFNIQSRDAIDKEKIRKNALAKLTDEEKKILGL